MKELIAIQSCLKAPKTQVNTFGNYKYRSCEDILEAVKPLLAKNGCHLTLSDDIVEVGGRIYVKATVTITNGAGETISNTAFAQEPESKKGMDASQLTGMSSSYARKYALNGLFAIDDTKDADTMDNRAEGEKTQAKPAPKAQPKIFEKKTLTIDRFEDALFEGELKKFLAKNNPEGLAWEGVARKYYNFDESVATKINALMYGAQN